MNFIFISTDCLFFKVLFCCFVVFVHKKGVSLRNAFIYTESPVSLWLIVSVRNMKPDFPLMPFTNTLVKIVHQCKICLPIQAFLPIVATYIGCKTEQVIRGANTANRHIQGRATETRIDVQGFICKSSQRFKYLLAEHTKIFNRLIRWLILYTKFVRSSTTDKLVKFKMFGQSHGIRNLDNVKSCKDCCQGCQNGIDYDRPFIFAVHSPFSL